MPEAPDSQPILLTPGPVSLTPAVAAALSRPLVFHRGADFHVLHHSLVERLGQLFDAPASHEVLVLSGSGTMANEAMLSSTLGPQDEALVLVNGQFAERLAEILRLHGVPHRALAVPWGSAFDLAAVERAVRSPATTAVVMVAMETSLGLVNPVKEVGQLCRALGKLYFVDAVSALGVEQLSVHADGISFCSSVGNKGIGAAPGVSFVCADRATLRSRRPPAGRSWYLDLHRYADFAERHEMPTTPPVPVLLGLQAALEEMLAEGVERRRARCRGLSAVAIEAAAALGAAPFVPEALASVRASAVTTLLLPDDVPPAEIVDWFRSHGFVMHEVRVGNTGAVQVAVMGAVREVHMRRWAELLAVFRERRRAPNVVPASGHTSSVPPSSRP